MAKIHFTGAKGPRGGELLVFHCPGCRNSHPIEINAPYGNGWTWNGDLERPTFHPSLLCNKDFPESRCHSFVYGGNIQFLDDCFHELAGKTVEIPDWE